ncbi:MAG TPA: aldehyde dehydrogenase family protein [Candidatus Thermoplasmatota archaeon]|nr:aldehyde dehydrogenase family protein [Candidatus Thermoplasmatota archaeon]
MATNLSAGKEPLAPTGEYPHLDAILRDDLFRPIVRMNAVGIPEFPMFIGGKWLYGERTMGVHTPIDGSVVAAVPQASEGLARAAVDAAVEARRAIRDIPGAKRVELFEKAARLLREHFPAFREALLLEAGKPHHDQEGETKAAVERMLYTRAEASHIYGDYLPGDWANDTLGKMALVIREPLGVLACITPFNYPLFIPTAKIAPALVAGNTVVAKSSSTTPLSLLLLARVLETAGFPPGSLNVATGAGAVVGETWVKDERVRMVSFTGSTEVGRRLHAIGGLKRFHLELGGKAHSMVYDDADVPMAAAKSVEGACKNAGQRCDAVSAVVVVQDVLEEFLEEAAQAAQKWKVGDPRRPETKMGPMISERAAARVEGLVAEATAGGAKVLTGGTRDGTYFSPTVLRDVTERMRVAREETFGPLVPVLAARDEEDALRIAQTTEYGLDSCVFTRSFERMWRAAKRIQCGEVTINDLPKHGIGHFPFGGRRESGLGREGIGYSIEEMTEPKTIVFNLGPR